MSVEVRAIREEEREECLNLWCTVWPGENSATYFRRYFYGDVEWLPYYTQVAVVDGQIASAIQICKRIVACGDFRLTMGGIANVATLPEYRGRGYNTLCMERAVAVMEADAMDFSLLFTGIHGYYARQGYATLPRPSLAGNLNPDFVPHPTTLQVRPATSNDLPALFAVYDAYNRQRPFAVQRDPAYWRDWLGISADKLPESLLVAVTREGVVVGYIRPGHFNSAIPYSAADVEKRIIEFGVLAENEAQEREISTALLEAVAANILAHGAKRLRLEVAFTPVLLRVLESILTSLEWHESTSGMVRLLHRTNLLQSFTLEWNDRWRAAGSPAGILIFETPYGPVQLDATRSFLRVEPTDAVTGILPQATLFGLLFGIMKAEQASEDTLQYPLLSALFPSQAAVYWGSDGF